MRLGSGLILSIAITLGFTFGVSVRGDEAASELKKTSLDTSKQTTFQLTPRIKATRLKSEENGVYKIQFESGSSRLTAAYLRERQHILQMQHRWFCRSGVLCVR